MKLPPATNRTMSTGKPTLVSECQAKHYTKVPSTMLHPDSQAHQEQNNTAPNQEPKLARCTLADSRLPSPLYSFDKLFFSLQHALLLAPSSTECFVTSSMDSVSFSGWTGEPRESSSATGARDIELVSQGSETPAALSWTRTTDMVLIWLERGNHHRRSITYNIC